MNGGSIMDKIETREGRKKKKRGEGRGADLNTFGISKEA